MKNKILLLTMVFVLTTLTACAVKGNNGVNEKDNYVLQAQTDSYEMKVGERVLPELLFTKNAEVAEWSLLTFNSSNQSVVTIDESFNLCAVGEGTAKIVISVENISVEVNVVVNSDVIIEAIKSSFVVVNKENYNKDVIELIVKENGLVVENPVLDWRSTDESVLTVDGNGIVTGKKAGNVSVEVTYKNHTKKIKLSVLDTIAAEAINSYNEAAVNMFGRVYVSNDRLNLDQVASSIEVAFFADYLTFSYESTGENYLCVFVDDADEPIRFELKTGINDYTINGLEYGYHKVRIVKSSEIFDGQVDIFNFRSKEFLTVPKNQNLKIEFIGDSITCGYGALGNNTQPRTIENSDGCSGFAYQTAKMLNADYSIVAAQGICIKVNMWIPDWNMEQLYEYVSPFASPSIRVYNHEYNPDVIVLALGTNESSYLSQNSAYGMRYYEDYMAFLKHLRVKNPNAYIVCVYGMGGLHIRIDENIIKAISLINDDKIVYLNNFIANTDGANFHPNSKAQSEWANILVKYIKGLVF